MNRTQFLKSAALLVGLQGVAALGLIMAVTSSGAASLGLGMASIILFGYAFVKSIQAQGARLRNMAPAADRGLLYGGYFLSLLLTSGLTYFLLFFIPGKAFAKARA